MGALSFAAAQRTLNYWCVRGGGRSGIQDFFLPHRHESHKVKSCVSNTSSQKN